MRFWKKFFQLILSRNYDYGDRKPLRASSKGDNKRNPFKHVVARSCWNPTFNDEIDDILYKIANVSLVSHSRICFLKLMWNIDAFDSAQVVFVYLNSTLWYGNFKQGRLLHWFILKTLFKYLKQLMV